MKTAKLPKELSKLYVSRAAFAKMQAERDRLKKDIHTMVMGEIMDAAKVRLKWRKEFQFWKDIQEGLRKIAEKEYPHIIKQKK